MKFDCKIAFIFILIFIAGKFCLAQSLIYNYTGNAETYIVPNNVKSILFDAQGAVGGSAEKSAGGYGGRVQGKIAVTPGMVFYIHIGGQGLSSNNKDTHGGYNGGAGGNYYSGSGGGATDIRLGNDDLSSRIIVAGGGGGAFENYGSKNDSKGGDGGGLVGGNGFTAGNNNNAIGGQGGGSIIKNTDANGSILWGIQGELGQGSSPVGAYGGGGGGGYYGGTGGNWSGGGGGSSYASQVVNSVTHTQGYNKNGDGLLIISPQYEIIPVHKPEVENGDIFLSDNPKPKVGLWFEIFCDVAFKAIADTLLSAKTARSQFSRVPENTSLYQFRRIDLGYSYKLNERFSAEVVIAAADDNGFGHFFSSSVNVKVAKLRWKNIFKGTDLIMGQLYTPAFHDMSEQIWSYRSIERTISDVYRTPEIDLGMALQGTISKKKNIGYKVMIGNGNAQRAETDRYKWFYGDIYGKFLQNRLVLDFYADYEKILWNPNWHRDRQMNKLFIAYTVPKITIGFEAFINTLMGDNIAIKSDGITTDTLTTRRIAMSFFVRGSLYKNKLGYFARYDRHNWGTSINTSVYQTFNSQTPFYENATNQQFLTFGVDYKPYENIHFMPNVYYNYYENVSAINYGADNKGAGLTYRITLAYLFT